MNRTIRDLTDRLDIIYGSNPLNRVAATAIHIYLLRNGWTQDGVHITSIVESGPVSLKGVKHNGD